jgi:signal transduction histidine kinase
LPPLNPAKSMFSLLFRWLTLLCTCLTLVACAPASDAPPQTLVVSQQWHMDPTGKETLQEIEKATDWQELPDWNSWGFGQETIWVRLRLKAGGEDPRAFWIVRVRPAFLDYVTLYDPATGLVARSGDAVPPEAEDLTSIQFRFKIMALPQERTVYLQMRSTSARTMHVQVQPYGQDLERNRLADWAMGFVMAASVIIAIWAFMQWSISRDKVIGAFALKQLFSAAWSFFFLGFARVAIGGSLPEGVLTTISTMVFIGIISATLWFFTQLIEGYQPARWALRALRVMACAVLLLPVLHWMGEPHLMVKISNQAVLVSFAMLIVAMATALPRRVKQPIPIGVLLGYMLIYSFLNSLPALIHLGFMDPHPIVLFGGFAHAVLDGIVMFILLQIRAQRMRAQQAQTALELQLSRQQAVTEKRHREEQSQLFAMLAHEMKTPLATLRMWMEVGPLTRSTMERAIGDMNQVIERCVHTGQLVDQGLKPEWQSVDALALSLACIESCREPDRVDPVAPDPHGLLKTDAQMLSIVLGNLLDNACKYAAPGSRIGLSLEQSFQNGQAGWRWLVRNQAGPAGLPDPERLFEKYYRSPQARRLSGSGLGLFLVKGLVELIRGSIHYEVHEGQAVFILWLPQEHPASNPDSAGR